MPDNQHVKVRGWFDAHSQTETNYTGDVVHPITGEVSHPPSMTKQEFVAECDINNIIREYLQTGQVAHINAKAAQGVFADLPASMDFQEAVALVQNAGAAFAQLPARVRDRFQNDPEAFLAFTEDPNNSAELVELGLATARPNPDSNLGEAVQAPPATESPK